MVDQALVPGYLVTFSRRLPIPALDSDLNPFSVVLVPRELGLLGSAQSDFRGR
jgi:hypothetical protein